MKLEDLGLLGNDLQSATTACQKLHGLIMLTGPKSSGKTTSFYSILNETYFNGINITSLEDPIECKLNNINQSEIDETLGYTFEMAIDSVLKQDPDVLAVSESTTKKITGKLIKSAINGRLIISTMLADSLEEAISALLATGVDPTVVFSSINLIINQRLVKKLCEHCKEQVQLTETEKKIVKSEIDKMPSVERDLLKKGGLKFYQGKGCNRCHHRGYKGEIGLFELLKMPTNMKKEALSKLDATKIKKLIYDNTMTLVQDGILKASLGMTTIEEVINLGQRK
jgi:type II secretory ATPase GspE/PulE/Tfp pilus assembly ATPase PilB-like protein